MNKVKSVLFIVLFLIGLLSNILYAQTSCEEECKQLFQKGAFKKGVSVEDCINASCVNNTDGFNTKAHNQDSVKAARKEDLNKELLQAVKQDAILRVQSLIAEGADVNAKYELGMTVLWYAASKGYSRMVETLLANGADANARDEFGNTALMSAEAHGYTEVVRLLKQYGASEGRDVNYEHQQPVMMNMNKKGASVQFHADPFVSGFGTEKAPASVR